MDRKTKGNHGEELTKKRYESTGGEILETNYRYRKAEIDLIVLEKEELLIFVEVKMRSRNDFGDPEMFVSEAQQNRIKEAAEDYIFGINWSKEIRFDIACVDGGDQIEIFKDAF